MAKQLFGSFSNRIMERQTNGAPTPEVGMGATTLWYSDRHACTITEVNGKTIKVREDKVTGMGGPYTNQWECEYDPNGLEMTFTLRKNGRWVHKGDSMDGLSLMVGKKDHYYDHEF